MAEDHSFLTRLYRPELISLAGYCRARGLGGSLWACVFHSGISGSFLDAMAHFMLTKAQNEGRLAPGGRVLDEGGSAFGPALAWAGSLTGHPVTLVVPHNTEPERLRFLQALGAQLVYSTSTDPKGLCAAAQNAAPKHGAFFLNHFASDDNAQFHRLLTAQAVFRGLPEVGAVVAGVTTGGTVTGVGEYARGHSPNTRIVAVEPADCPVIGGGGKGPGSIPGLGVGFVPPLYNPYVVDTLMAVSARDASECAIAALCTEGLPASPAGGAVLAAAEAYMRQTGCRSMVCVLDSQKVVK